MRIVLAPGASGNATSLQRRIDGIRARGLDADAIDIPRRRAEDAIESYLVASGEGADVVIGGQSYGGRVASLLAAEATHTFAGLILLSYPFHRPGAPEWEPRTSHWLSIRCPVLMLSGERDPFARIDLLRHAVAERLPHAELVTYPRLGHTIEPVLDDALDRVASFASALTGAGSSW